MITVKKALDIINSMSRDYGTEEVSLVESEGRILSEEIIADRDFPPFDRVTMDGIAINYAAYQAGKRSFSIESIAAAGSPFQNLTSNDNCIEVMTGAGMPKGCDTVIRYEDLEIDESLRTANLVKDLAVRETQNVHFKGSDQARGNILLPVGTTIRSSEIGIAASEGHSALKVKALPTVAIISTGDELVSINEKPLPYQIRKSNVYTIQSCLKKYAISSKLFHLADNEEDILISLKDLLVNYDVLILSGGVSKGKYDFIPDALSKLGVTKHFHKVKQRPGKPFWFGTKGEKVIFALPGNPVSSFVSTKKYIESWLRKSLNISGKQIFATLSTQVIFKSELHYLLEVEVEYTSNGQIIAHPKKGNGSGDFVNLRRAHALIELPLDKSVFEKGETYPIIVI